jgi:branched-chain amino acid transport system substrate-binding protein
LPWFCGVLLSDVPLFSISKTHTSRRSKEACPPARIGIASTDIYVPSMPGDVNAAFVEAYKAKVGIAPKKLELLWFEGASVVAQAIQKSGTTDVAKLAQLIHKDTWQTPRGELKFDQTGQALSTPFIVTVKDGRIVRQ